MEQQEILDQTNQSSRRTKRPTAITVVCILGFIGAALAIGFIGAALIDPRIFPFLGGQIWSWYPAYFGLSSVIAGICFVGLWRMKKWGVYTYSVLVGLNQLVLLTMGGWNIMTLIIPVIMIVIALEHVHKMD